jgi:hypothetical protein
MINLKVDFSLICGNKKSKSVSQNVIWEMSALLEWIDMFVSSQCPFFFGG